MAAWVIPAAAAISLLIVLSYPWPPKQPRAAARIARRVSALSVAGGRPFRLAFGVTTSPVPVSLADHTGASARHPAVHHAVGVGVAASHIDVTHDSTGALAGGEEALDRSAAAVQDAGRGIDPDALRGEAEDGEAELGAVEGRGGDLPEELRVLVELS